MNHVMRVARKWGKRLKNTFIPHEGNGHRPHLLRPRTVAFVCLVIIAAETAFILGATYIIPRSKFFGIIDANALVDETNQQRTQDNLPQLTVSPLLTQAAQDKVNNMVADNYFAHVSPTGITPWYWFEKVGYAFSYAGENLAVDFTDSQQVTNAWMQSPEHRANILDTHYTQVGIATAQGTYDGKPAVYVAEEFGTPAAAPVAFVNSASAAEGSNGTYTVTVPANETVTGQKVQSAAAPTQNTTPASTPTQTQSSPSSQRAPKVIASVPVANASEKGSGAGANSSSLSAASAATASVPVASAVSLPATSTTAAAAATGQPQPQENALQRLISNPGALANDFYLFIIALFGAAIIANLFVKIRVQYPHLIFGGMAVIVVAGLLIVFNQSLGFFHAVI